MPFYRIKIFFSQIYHLQNKDIDPQMGVILQNKEIVPQICLGSSTNQY